jgi:hypothetical protein
MGIIPKQLTYLLNPVLLICLLSRILLPTSPVLASTLNNGSDNGYTCEFFDFQIGTHDFVGIQAPWGSSASYYVPGEGWTSDYFVDYGYRIAIEKTIQTRRVLSTTVTYTPGSHSAGHLWTTLTNGGADVQGTPSDAPPGSTEYTTTYNPDNGSVDKISIYRFPALALGDPSPAYIRSLTICSADPEPPPPPPSGYACEFFDFQIGTHDFVGVQAPWGSSASYHVPGEGWTSDFFSGYGYRIAIEKTIETRKILSTTVTYTAGNYPGPGSLLWTKLYNGEMVVQATYPELFSNNTEYTTAYNTDNGSVNKIWIYRFPALVSGDQTPAYVRSLTICSADPEPQPGILQVSPTQLDFEAIEGGADPASQSFTITNDGTGTLNWTASETMDWLNLSSTNGVAPATVNASVNIDGLSAGTYIGQISIQSEGVQNSPQTLQVKLTIDPQTAPLPIHLNAETGFNSIELTWNSVNSPYVKQYRLSRAVENNQNFTPIATTTETIYFDTDPFLTPDTVYCYRVEALQANGDVVAISDTACAIFGQVTLWIPDAWGAHGQTVIVPINIRNATGLRIAASDIWLEFDKTVLEPLGVLGTPLTAGYSWDYYIDSTESRIRISSLASTPPTLWGDGSLFWIRFHVLETGNESLLDLREFIAGLGGSTIYTPEDVFNPIPLHLQDGLFQVANGYSLGDLNGNNVIEAIDAYIALQIASQKLTPTSQQLAAGDINGNGQVDAADATMIFYHVTHGEWPTIPTAASSLAASAAGTIRLSLDNVNGQPGSTVVTTLRAENLSNWAGGELIITYDPTLVESVTNISVTGLATNFAVQFHDNGAGLLRIALADDAPINGTGALLAITLQLASDAVDGSNAPLTLAETRLNDPSGRDFVTSALQQNIERINGHLQIGDPQIKSVYLPLIIK